MKRLVFAVGLVGLFLGLNYHVEAANIEAILDTADGTSSFSVKDSASVEVSRIDSNGNIQADGTITTATGLTDQSATSYLGTKIINYSTTSDFTIEPRVTTYDLLLQPTGDGEVGIGTTTPDTKLHVIEANTANNIAKFVNSANSRTTYINQWGDLYTDNSAALYTLKVKILESGTTPTYRTILQSGDLTGADVTFTLPINDGDADQLLKTDGAGVLSWVAAGAGDITAVGDVASGAAFTADGTGNVLYFEGATADLYETILQGADVVADVTFTLPINDGDANQMLTTDGAGVLSWTAAGTVGGSGTTDYIPYWSAASTLANSPLKRLANGNGIQLTSYGIICKENTTSYVKLCGGTEGDGGNLVLFGSTQADAPGEVEINIGGSGIVDINGNVDVSGTLKIGAYTLPNTDGTNTQVLQTNGSGAVSWASAGGVDGSGTANYIPLWSDSNTLANSHIKLGAAAGKYEISDYGIFYKDDATGYMKFYGGTDGNGANLVLFGGSEGSTPSEAEINASGGVDINANVDVSGTLKIGAYTLPNTDGSDTHVLTTNGAGTVTWAAGGGGGGVGGSGTAGKIPYWSASTTLADSELKRLGVGIFEVGGNSILCTENATGLLQMFGGGNGGGAYIKIYGESHATKSYEIDISAPYAKDINVTGVIINSDGIRIGADAANNEIDDSTNGDGSTTLYLGNKTIDTTAVSDIRVKQNIADTKYGLDDLLKLEVVDFNFTKDYTGDTETIHTGMIAQQVEKIYPYAIKKIDNEKYADFKMIEYKKLIPLLVKSIQELEQRVKELEAARTSVN